MNNLELKLSKLHDKKYCILVGNGTTAIYLAIESQNFKDKKIVIPNNVCMNVVLPIYFSNNKPIFLDIEKNTLGIDLNLLKKIKVDATIAVHAYGNICDIENIKEYCNKNNIFLIEDVAVSQGLNYQKQALGSFGDVSILSFGSGKVIDIEHGGAILTDDKTIYENIKEKVKELKHYTLEDEKILNMISKKHTKLYNIDYGKSLNKYSLGFKKLCIDNKSHFLYQFDNKYLDKLDIKLENLNKLLEIRKNNTEYLNNIFKNENLKYLTILESTNNSSFWRFNIFIEKYRDELFSYLLSRKYKVSSWYHSIDILFEDMPIHNTPISDWVSETIINIWVNEDIDNQYLNDISKDIISFLKDKECQ